MNTVNQRLEIFLNASIITQEEKNILEQWVVIIDNYSQDYDQEKLERMITHSAMMMKRQREKQTLGCLSEEIYRSIKEHELYEDCKSLFNKMNQLYEIDSEEEKYLILHLCSCLQKGDKHE